MPAKAVERRLTAILAAGKLTRAARSSLPLLQFALGLMPTVLARADEVSNEAP